MTKAAFEVGRGPQQLLSLGDGDVAQYLDPAELLRELEASFGALARGDRKSQFRAKDSRLRCRRGNQGC